MSRSNNVELKNPSERFLRWDGEHGGFHYWDKSLGEKGERVKVGLPFEFVVLDILSTVKGFDDSNQSGYWSNEVRNISKDELVVRNSKGICAKGMYGEIIKDLTGARYCQSVYVAYDDFVGGWKIGNIQMMGSALSAWIDYRKKGKVFSGKIVINEMKDGKKGKTEYKIPVFTWAEIPQETDDTAKGLDVQLQDYLGKYIASRKNETVEEHPQETPTPTDAPSPDPEKDDLPF